MPRLVGVPSTGCDQICFPVVASSATKAGPSPIAYMTPSPTSGLNGNLLPRPGTRWVQASSSLLTFVLLICLSDEYCIESMAPPKSLHVAYGCFWPTDCPRTATRPANSIETPAVPREPIEECRVFLFISVLSPEESRLSASFIVDTGLCSLPKAYGLFDFLALGVASASRSPSTN